MSDNAASTSSTVRALRQVGLQGRVIGGDPTEVADERDHGGMAQRDLPGVRSGRSGDGVEPRWQGSQPLKLKLGRVTAGWGRHLAEVSGIGTATITRVENGHPGNKSMFFVLEHGLGERGIVIVPADLHAGPGMRVPKASPTR